MGEVTEEEAKGNAAGDLSHEGAAAVTEGVEVAVEEETGEIAEGATAEGDEEEPQHLNGYPLRPLLSGRENEVQERRREFCANILVASMLAESTSIFIATTVNISLPTNFAIFETGASQISLEQVSVGCHSTHTIARLECAHAMLMPVQSHLSPSPCRSLGQTLVLLLGASYIVGPYQSMCHALRRACSG